MSGIVLSASVRQNLLSLQSTASLLATTQNDLSTGNKVHTALDNPTEYLTVTSDKHLAALQSLVPNAQSISNQVLQSPTCYDTKSNVVSQPLANATSVNLLGAVSSPVTSSN